MHVTYSLVAQQLLSLVFAASAGTVLAHGTVWVDSKHLSPVATVAAIVIDCLWAITRWLMMYRLRGQVAKKTCLEVGNQRIRKVRGVL